MALTLYKQKRNFKQTSEPEGKKKSSRGKLAFVIQRHDATRLHYDFRLEMDGVMKSWAVPKGPSLNPDDKRLAMMVEDHPYDYKNFYGTIPKGNYGAGEVEIWDEGSYTDIHGDDSPKAEKKLLADLEKGEIKFILHGKNLQGEFVLVKIRGGKYGEKGNPWLLIKHRDPYSTTGVYDISKVPSLKVNNSNIYDKKKKNYGATAAPKKNAASSVTPRGSSGWRRGTRQAEDAESKKKFSHLMSPQGARTKLGYFIKPMLAKETDKPFDDEGWVFEVKWDGYRAVSELFSGKVNLYSRNGLVFNDAYPIVVQRLTKMKIDAALDGEIVALDDNGVPSFQLLQQYAENPNVPLVYYVFDLIRLNKRDVTDLTLLERKELLREIIKKDPVIRYSDHVEEHGIDFFHTAVAKNLEGIIAKKKDSRYFIGRRSSDWLKIKDQKTDEAIIIGYTEPRRSRKYFGSLLLAHYDDGELKYIGNVGTGFDDKLLKSIYEQLQPLRTDRSPVKEKIKTPSPHHWVKPKLVANVRFQEKTADGQLRFPAFLGLRPDKFADEVSEHEDVSPPDTAETENDSEVKIKSSNRKSHSPGSHRHSERSEESSVNKKAKKQIHHDSIPIDENKALTKLDVPFTNTSKIYFPKQKITKGDVIQYYFSVAPYILPYLKDRPESMKRTPNGIADKGFYQKDATNLPSWVKSRRIYSESNNKDINYILCNDVRTLVYMANLGCIELNPWHSTIQKPEHPDYLIIDIDPSDENTFEQVIECAQVVKEILDRIKVDGYCKTSGASGMHIYIPLAKKYNYEATLTFAEIIAHVTSDQLPDTTTLERSLSKRPKNKIYVDFLQNRKGQTIAAPYSMRPVEAASISTPLDWKEVKRGLHPSDFTLDTIFDRLDKKGDLFKGVLGKGADILKAIKMLEKM